MNISRLLAVCFFMLSCAFTGSAQDKRSGYITVGKLQVYYEQVGKGDPLLLLHAGFQDISMWKPQVKELADKFRFLLIDLPGHGNTKGQDPNLLVADLIKIVLDELHISRLSIAGLSLGSVAAQEFTVAYPSMVKRLVLLSPGVNGFDLIRKPDSLAMTWYKELQAAQAAGDLKKAAKIFADAWAKGPYRVEGQVKNGAYNLVYTTTLENLQQHTMSEWMKMQPGVTAAKRIKEINCPVLIIDGDKDMPYVNLSCNYIQKEIPSSKRYTIRGVAHMLNIEQPSRVNELLKDFLDD